MWFFVLAVEQRTSSIPSARSWRVHGSIPKQSTCVLWTWRKRVPWGVLWGVLRENRVPDPLIGAVRSLYDR